MLLLIVTPAVYPHLVVKYDSKPSEDHFIGSPEFPHQNLRQITPGVNELWSDKQINKKQNYNFINIDVTGKLMDALNCFIFILF